MTDFTTVQRDFVAHIRDPENQAFNYDIEDRRMGVYRDLFFNNICGFIDTGFPVLKSLYTEDAWRQLSRDFFVQHACRSPFFVDISKEFVEFLSNEYEPKETDPPFLAALAHYEWVELDVSIRKGNAPLSESSQLSSEAVIGVSDVASLVSYEFPVHQISPDFQPQEPSESVFLIVYRTRDDRVEFTLINQVTAFLIDTIEQNDTLTVPQLNQVMAEAMPQMETEQLASAINDILAQFIDNQILTIVD